LFARFPNTVLGKQQPQFAKEARALNVSGRGGAVLSLIADQLLRVAR
jgi:hypothetical protein